MRLGIPVSILLALVTVSARSAPTCEEYVRSRDPDVGLLEQDVCYCGSQLANLEVTLPPGLRVEAVCALRFDTLSGPHPIDLTREKVSLDSYTNGGYPEGLVYLSGSMSAPLTGTVRAEEGDAGSLWFSANSNRRGPVFSEQHLTGLKLGSDDDYSKLGAPKPESVGGECREAEATLKIHDPVVLLGQTDEAGTRGQFDVIRVSAYTVCAKFDGGPADPLARLVRGQPADVVGLAIRLGGCNYWRGDWPYAEESRKKEIAAELAKLDCPSVPNEEKRVRDKYVGNATVLGVIDAAKALEY